MCTIIKWGQCAWVVCQYTGPMLATQSILRPKHQDNTCWVIAHNTRTILYLSKNWLKGTVSWDFRHFFEEKKKLHLGPIWTGKNGFTKYFVFTKIFTKNICPRSHRLRGHGQDYTDTFKKLWRLPTDFKGTIRWKRYLGVFTNPIAII